MSVNEAMNIFSVENLNELTSDELKKIYRKLCFMYHPDAHPNEDSHMYAEQIKNINEAYSILQKQLLISEAKNKRDDKEINLANIQIEKEKILMDIIVKAYYSSKNEIDKINSDFLDIFLSIPHNVGRITQNGKPIASYNHIKEAFNEKSKQESEIMKKYIKYYALSFANKYGVEIDPIEIVTGEYINFLNNTDWYDKFVNYEEKNDIKKLN